MKLVNLGHYITRSLFVVAALLLGAGPVSAQLKISIVDGHLDPLPIAIAGFIGTNEASLRVGSDIREVVLADLERTGLFRPIDPQAFIQNIADFNVPPRFGDWRIINADALVTGRAELLSDGRLKVEFRLWDVRAEEQMTGVQLFTTPDNWRSIAHGIADAIYERLTGEKGYFNTRIVYVAETGPKNKRVKRLAIMDQDGARHKYLSAGNALVLTPRFSPTAQEITFLAYYNNRPRVYLLNIETAQQEVVGDFPGMTFAPRFSPDGRKIIMSLSRSGNANIFTLELGSRRIQQLTNSSAIDTSPSYAPDARQVVFNSDRGGSPQLYVMNADGTGVQRISHGEGQYSTPVWSPRGDLIAFTKIRGGRFYIGVMRPDGSGERLLTESFLDEGPTWSPNGRVLMFFRQTPSRRDGSGGSTSLWSVDLTGHNTRMVPTPVDASDPAWSGLIR
jgi:TolB protein